MNKEQKHNLKQTIEAIKKANPSMHPYDVEERAKAIHSLAYILHRMYEIECSQNCFEGNDEVVQAADSLRQAANRIAAQCTISITHGTDPRGAPMILHGQFMPHTAWAGEGHAIIGAIPWIDNEEE